MDSKARNRKLMRRLARQLGQAAQTAANYHEDNPQTNLNRSVKAATERATRRFIRREIKPLLIKKQLKAENYRLMNEAMNMQNRGGCFDTRGNKISCPLSYRSYEAITSVKRAVFDDFGRFVREEDSNSFSMGMGSLRQSHSLMYQNTAPMMQVHDPNRPATGPLVHRWAKSKNFFISSAYNFFNDVFQVLQIIDFDIVSSETNPLTGKQTNINLDGSANYHSADGLVNTLAFAIPYGRGVSMISKVMPKGLGYVGKLNAVQFSKTFKGNLSKMSPKLRGQSNRLLNKLIVTYNGNFPTGMILLKSGKFKRQTEGR